MHLLRSLGFSVAAAAPSNGANCYWDWCSLVLQTLVVPYPCFASPRLHFVGSFQDVGFLADRSFRLLMVISAQLDFKIMPYPGSTSDYNSSDMQIVSSIN